MVVILAEYKEHRNWRVCSQVYSRVEPHDLASCVLLSNSFAVTGKWACRDHIRKMMKYRSQKRT
jgi:hypothetical protein